MEKNDIEAISDDTLEMNLDLVKTHPEIYSPLEIQLLEKIRVLLQGWKAVSLLLKLLRSREK